MKSLSIISALATFAVPVCLAVGADCVPHPLMNFPGNGMRLNGESVTMTPTAEFLAMQRALTVKLQQMPTEKKLEFFRNYSATTLLSYSADLWASPDDYEKYKTEWKKMTITPHQTVQVGAYNRGNNEWSLHGVSVNKFERKVTPLTICNLVYKADSNVWVSANGELAPTQISTTADNVYGARTGTAWVLRKEDALSRIYESLSISRRTNGEFLYLTYDFTERTPGTGTVLAQGSYVLRFRIGPPAPDPESASPQNPEKEISKPQPLKQEATTAPNGEKAKTDADPRKKKRKNRRRRRH